MMKFLLGVAAIAFVSAPSLAQTINFEEFAPDNGSIGTIPGTRYQYLGVTFVGTDDSSTWGGNSAGDPGNWDLEGTNGATFAGFNGSSYSIDLQFASALSQFSLDAARSNGSTDGAIMLEALFNGNSIGSLTATFGAINTWSTLSLAGGQFDTVRITGTGTGFHPFGIDNLSFSTFQTSVPEPSSWALMLIGFGAIGSSLRRRRRVPFAQLA